MLFRRVLFLVAALGAAALTFPTGGHLPDSGGVGASALGGEYSRQEQRSYLAPAPPPLELYDLATTTTTTTTTEPPPPVTTTAPPTTRPAPPSTAVRTDWPTSLQPCGGDLPPCSVKQRESGGNYNAVNPTGCGGYSCGGAWQFDPRTWNGYGGYQYAQDAPPAVQDAKARELWAGGAGCGHWAACG